MNLSELIRLSNRLENLTMADLQQNSLMRFSNIMYESNVPESGIDPIFRDNLNDQNKILQNAFSNIESDLINFRDEVSKLIAVEGIKWFQRSSLSYEKQLETKDSQKPEAVDLHRNKPVVLPAEAEALFKSRIEFYNNWQYPAVIIHPMLENFIQAMVGNDPLYLVDESHYLLAPALSQWNDNYKNRLREYHIEETFDQPILDKLPDGQFGVCLVYNYLNYRPYELIQKYLKEIYEKLRPGGVLIMTFNDCDYHNAMQLVEQNITCYTPGTLVKGYANFLGFEETFEYRDASPSVWLELKKPGTITSIRGGQALAKILPKPVA